MLSSELFPGIMYDQHEGRFYRCSVDTPENLLEVILDENNYLTYRHPTSGKTSRRKALNLAWEIMNGKIAKGFVAYAKNLNNRDIKGINIGIVDRETYRSINDALKNTNGAIKATPHKTDAFSYVVRYRENGKNKSVITHDIIGAMKIKRKILLKSLKILEKYIISY